MKVHLYGPDFNRKTEIGWRTTFALSAGLTKLGIEHEVRETRNWTGDLADRCIVNGWIKAFIDGRNRKTRNDVIRAHLAAGKELWCIERGFLGDRDEWSAMSIGGFAASGGDFRTDGVPSDRWNKLGIELQPWKTDGDYILLCAQVPWDAQVQDGDHLAWLNSTMRQIRELTPRPLKVRGHPKAWRQRDPYAGCDVAVKPPTTTFEQDLAGAHAVIAYNSNCAVGATIAGVPAFTFGPCLARPVTCQDLSRLEYPPKPDRTEWCARMGYSQWNVEEFRDALPWLHLTR